jgi:hypothetical protein
LAKESESEKTRSKPAFNGWRALRDVLVASMDKGQFPLAIVSLIVMVLIFKMPEQDVSKLVFLMLDHLVRGALLGWLLMGASIAAWFIHIRYHGQLLNFELNRLAEERSQLQARTLGGKMKSSEGRK